MKGTATPCTTGLTTPPQNEADPAPQQDPARLQDPARQPWRSLSEASDPVGCSGYIYATRASTQPFSAPLPNCHAQPTLFRVPPGLPPGHRYVLFLCSHTRALRLSPHRPQSVHSRSSPYAPDLLPTSPPLTDLPRRVFPHHPYHPPLSAPRCPPQSRFLQRCLRLIPPRPSQTPRSLPP